MWTRFIQTVTLLGGHSNVVSGAAGTMEGALFLEDPKGFHRELSVIFAKIPRKRIF